MALKHILMIGALAGALAACKMPQLPHLPGRTAEAEVKGPPPCPCAEDKAKTKVAKAPAPKAVPPTTRAPAPVTSPGRRAEPPQLAGAPPTASVAAARSTSQRVSAQRVRPQRVAARRATPPPAQPRRVARAVERRDYRARDEGAARNFSGRYAVQGPYPVAVRGRAVYVEQRDSYQSETFSESYSSNGATTMRGPPGPPPGAYVDGGYAHGGYAVERRYGPPPRAYVQDRYGPPPPPCHC